MQIYIKNVKKRNKKAKKNEEFSQLFTLFIDTSSPSALSNSPWNIL